MENNETYLADWFENKISDEEVQQYISNEEFLSYQKIKNSLKSATINEPNLDFNFQKIQDKIKIVKASKRNVIPLWKYTTIAATLLVFLASYFYLKNETSFKTGFGAKETIILVDNSKVILNAKSQLTYTNSFRFNRTLELDGEAFFEVQKGNAFSVHTNLGVVEVLGTKFNVVSNNNDFFEVQCFEGKVKVTANSQEIILTKGKNVRFFNNQVENWSEITTDKPSWIAFESTFKNAPLKQVFHKIKNQYGVELVFPQEIENTKFSGTITHKNIDTALKSICIPLRYNYKKLNATTIEIKNE